MDGEVSNVEARLLALGQACAERQERLHQLMELGLPTRAELNEAVELSSSLQLLNADVRRIRLGVTKRTK
jgi:hypothetical protein